MDAALRLAYDGDNRVMISEVSILVLVDAALRKDSEMRTLMRVQLGFNPCFSGCRPATSHKGHAHSDVTQFQSLF